jgi:predicted TPR repeat methyltransferase
MNRNERRASARLQAKTAASLHQRPNRAGTAKEVVDVSQRLFQLGRARDALPRLREAVAACPGDPDLREALAYALAATGQTIPAIEQYRALLEAQPDRAQSLTNLAFLLMWTGNLDEARERLERASELAPQNAATAFALAELLDKQGLGEEAFHHYRRAAVLFQQNIGASPGIQHCDDLFKLAIAQIWTGDFEAGLHSLDLAIELRPDHVPALARRGMVLVKLRRFPEGIASLRRAAAIEPNFAAVRRTLGDAFLAMGDVGAAQKQLEEATRIDPGDELARYSLAAARHERPDAPPPAYVVELFDEYAQHFERHLVDELQYRAPERACAAVLELAGSRAGDWRVIDLGCGTGLNGPLIRHAARHLTGVDLSPAMLEKAREKSVYDELKLGDVAEVLGGYSGAFDLALCTDVMIYLGSLTPIFAAAARALKAGALFAFTTETHSGAEFVLDTSKRYRHARGYVENEAASHGFAIVHFEPIVARHQNLEPDLHDLFIVRRKANAG